MAEMYTNNNYVPASVIGNRMMTGGPQIMMQNEIDNSQQISHLYSPETACSGYPAQPVSRNVCGVGDTGLCIQPGMAQSLTNHINFVPGHSSSIMTTLSSIAPASIGMGVTAPGSFTFTSPTRHSYISSPQLHSHPYGQSSVSTLLSSQTFAPGLGASGQHTVPQLMPWTENSSTAEPPLFTGSVTYSKPGFSQLGEPLPSCSSPPRRPKRHASDYGSEIPCKVYIGEEKMTASMKDLNLNGDNEESMLAQQEETFTHGDPQDSSSESVINRSWRKFRELEDMLSVDESTNLKGEPKHPKIHLSTTINKDLLNNNPLIPRKILDELLLKLSDEKSSLVSKLDVFRNKPCMQVVLWKPPGDLVKDLVPDGKRKDFRCEKLDDKKEDERQFMQSGNQCRVQSGERHYVQSLTELCSSISSTRPISSLPQISSLNVQYPCVSTGTENMDDDMEL